MIVVGSVPAARGDLGTYTGSTMYTFGSTVTANESNYTVFYTIPPVIETGVSTNMSFFVYVTVLSGWKIQSQEQLLELIVDTPTRQVTTEHLSNNVTLYQGGRWGPFNMTLDVNDTQAGLSPGQSVNATIFANLVVWEAYDNPASPFVQDAGGTLKLTSVEIDAPSAGGSSEGRLFTSLGVGAVVVVGLAGFAAVTRRRGKPEAPAPAQAIRPGCTRPL